MSLMPILGQLRNRRGNYDPSDPFSGLTPDELRSRMEYERNNPDEFRQGIMPVPRPRAYTDRRARPPISVRPVVRPQPFQPQPFQPQPVQEFNPLQLPVSGDKNTAESSRRGQFGQQPQFNQQGMQQMMQFMQQMMQMFSMMSRQGGQGGFGGGFNQRPPMFGGGFGGGMGGGFGGGFMNQGPYGGGFGRGGYQQPQQPRMYNNYSQGPFGGY